VSPAELREIAAVEAANAEFYVAFEGADLDRMSALWDVDGNAPVSCVHPGWPLIRGRQRVLRSWAVIMANTTYIQFVLTDVAVNVVGELAVVTCDENILTSAEPAEAGQATATNVFRRRGDGWRLWVHHGSPVLAADRPVPEELP
jgi:ketosteroid isomerase-like protein